MEFRPRRRSDSDLSGPWRVHPLDDELRRTGADADLDDGQWASLEVPGHWGQLPHLAEHDGPVLHRRRFSHRPGQPAERLWLRFDGVLSSAEVWLDGVYIGDTTGYFASHRFDVTELLAADGSGPGDERDHLLAVEVACPSPRSDNNKVSLTGSLQSGPLAPPGNPGGIWRPVGIDSTGPVAVRHARLLCLAAGEDRAELLIRLVLDAAEGSEIRIDTSVAGPDGSAAGGGAGHHTLASGENRIEWTVALDRPRLWWPAALGDQPLYDVAVAVRTADGELSDRREWRTGLRRIDVEDFIWRVNGERMFAKGIAYGPAGRFLQSVPDSRLGDDVQTVVDAGLDLLRVSAHIAPDALYRAADEAGLLIWQDLPLLGGYSSKIRSTVRAAARAAIDTLGHHPSVGLWCGHSEPSGRPLPEPQVRGGPRTGGGPATGADPATRGGRRRASALPGIGRWLTRQAIPGWNRSILDPVLGRELRNADRTRTVVTRSGTLPSIGDPAGTDAHLWLGWQVGRVADLPEILRRWPRLATFPGGIGSQSAAIQDWGQAAPDWATAERRAFARHIPRSAYGSGRGWAAASRTYQADLLRFHIETLRRLKYRPTGGFCLVALADPEPAGGFGILDNDRHPKLAYDVVTDACRPVVVIADPPPPLAVPGQPIASDVHAVSDLRSPLGQVQITATARWDDDRDVNVAAWSRQVCWEGDLAADDCARIGRFRFETPTGHGPLVIDLELVSERLIVTNRYRTVVIPASEAIDRPGLRRRGSAHR